MLGIEFDARHQFEAFKQIRIITPLIAIMASLIATIIAVLSFRRISNPRFKDMANTDYLTNLHNRNAFEIDFENLSTHKHNTGIIITDLNDLKKINDTYGHRTGDEYIKKVAKILEKHVQKNTVYRFGGDEFIILIHHDAKQQIKAVVTAIQTELSKQTDEKLSISIGFAVYDPKIDHDLKDTFKRADAKMYTNKKLNKEKNKFED